MDRIAYFYFDYYYCFYRQETQTKKKKTQRIKVTFLSLLDVPTLKFMLFWTFFTFKISTNAYYYFFYIKTNSYYKSQIHMWCGMAILNCKLPTVKHIHNTHLNSSSFSVLWWKINEKEEKKNPKNSDWIASTSMAEIGFFVNEIEIRSAKTIERRRKKV